MSDKFLSMCGLARRAGKIIIGTNMSVAAIRGNVKPCLVVLSSDASENSVKKINDACRFHNVEIISSVYSMIELGISVGQNGGAACIAVTDDGFARKITQLYLETVADSRSSQEVK